jgi:gas vesicle GvpC-like protein
LEEVPVISLKDSWQEQHQQRQQELVQRQHQVRETLMRFRQERQVKAAQLRDDLELFQLELQEETQNFLVHTGARRQVQAQQLARQLQEFTQALQEQTAQFLSMSAANRFLMAQQLTQDLSEFHANLSTSVAVLRQNFQEEMRQFRAEIQVLLQSHQQQRFRQQTQLMQDLTDYVETLHSAVQTYLSELELMRQDRAQQLQQMFRQERDRRAVEMSALFQQLSEFRVELQIYCTELHQGVWGETVGLTPDTTQPALQIKGAKPVAVPAPTPQPRAIASQSQIASLPAVPLENTVAGSNSSPKPIRKDSAQLEQEVYQHLHQVQGARLTEIETALGINRFQAVDALRLLIKKGLITQRDRVYLVQEEASL